MALTDGLVAFWKLEEASGTRADHVGANDLTDVNTVTQNPGIVGNAAQFTAANSERLEIVDNTDLSTGDIDFTLSAWVYLDTTGVFRNVITKWEGAGANIEYLLRVNASNQATFTVGNGASNGSATFTTTALSGATWYNIIAWHDSVANTISVTVNANATPASAAWTTGVLDGGSKFALGFSIGAGTYWNGRIDAVGLWKRALSSTERDEVYNAGSGWEPTSTTNQSISATGTFAASLAKTLYKTLGATGSWLATLTARITTFRQTLSATGSWLASLVADFLAAFRPTSRIATHPAEDRTAVVPARVIPNIEAEEE